MRGETRANADVGKATRDSCCAPLMNRGGRGHKTDNKHCYTCCSERDKASFSATQWEIAEEKKSRRCKECIKDGIMVGAIIPGQTDLYGNVLRPHLPKTPTPAASASSPPAEPPPADEPPLAAAGVVAAAQAAAPTAAAPLPAEPPLAAAAPPPPEPPQAAAGVVAAVQAATPTATAVPKKRHKKTLDVAMQQRIAEALTDNNKSLAIPPAIVAASIDAAMTYTRSHALAVRDKQWAPSRKLPVVTFEEPPAEGEPEVDKFMAAGAQLLIADWREFGYDAFKCKCSADMVVMAHEKDVDGVKRDKLSCSTRGKLGLTKLVGFGVRKVVTSPMLGCTVCTHSAPMHSAEILAQLPRRVQKKYPADILYADGMQVHFSRDLTDVSESLYEESPTSLAAIIASLDESLALQYETAMEDYHEALCDHLDTLSTDSRTEVLKRLPVLSESERKVRFGVAPTDGVLADRVEAKLIADTKVRADELRSITPPSGERMQHICADDNDPIAKAVQVAGKHETRKLHLQASAQTGQILSAVLVPDASFKSKEQAIINIKQQLGEPHIYALDNLPSNSKEYQAILPSTTLTQDLKHFEARVKNTANSYSKNYGEQIKKLAGMFMVTRKEGEHSIASIMAKLRGEDGGIKDGGKVMIERGKGKTQPKFFTFGAKSDGIVMPEHTIESILANGCFEETFKHNLVRDWKPVDEILTSLTQLRNDLKEVTMQCQQVRTAIRKHHEQTITDQSNARTVCLAHAVADAAKAAQGAVAACLEPNVMETAALESIEEAAMAAANAACMALVPATETAPTVATLSALVSNDRRDFYDAIQGMPDLGRKLKAVGVTFGANGGVEHTWTTTTLPALELAISKVKWLDRPAHVPRYLIEGEDSRGLPKLRIIDGTNMAETSFGELEKAISANGGYNEKKWQGLLLNKIGRLNERRRVQFCNISGPGHYNLEGARAHNALMAAHGLPLPHPHLPPLAPRSEALYGIDYFHAELKRRRTSAIKIAAAPLALTHGPTALFVGTATVHAATTATIPAGLVTSKPAASGSKRPRAGDEDLPGIIEGMVTYGMGAAAQRGWDLDHKPLCRPGCPAFGLKKKARHVASCEHDIIRYAKRVSKSK